MHCLLVLRGVLTHWHPTGHSLTLVRAGAGTVMHRSGFEGYRAFFFFLAADGIRDADVTGVQTCALPISPEKSGDGSIPDSASGRLLPSNQPAPAQFAPP